MFTVKNNNQIIQFSKIPEERKNNPLYLSCRRIEKEEMITLEFQNFLNHMYQTMIHFNGIGIAANQIGKNLQIFIIEAKKENPRYSLLGEVPFQVFINPRILNASQTLYNFWHGCLSASSEKRGNLAHYEWIEYECLDESGHFKKGRLEGLASVIFQHEFRHLLGGTYLDFACQFLTKSELDIALEQKKEFLLKKINPGILTHIIGDYSIGDPLELYMT